MFQKSVNRNYTTGFAGEIVRDGPTRANVFRVAALSAAAIALAVAGGRAYGNAIARVYGTAQPVDYAGQTGKTFAAFDGHVQVGGANYAGVLIHPKHYTLLGTPEGGTLAPSYEIPTGSEGEFSTMSIIVAEIFNPTKAAIATTGKERIGYAPNTLTAAQDDTAIPVGGIVVGASDGSALPAGFVEIPGAKLIYPVQLGASATGAALSTLAVLQLTL